jgi:hypothetical protein
MLLMLCQGYLLLLVFSSCVENELMNPFDGCPSPAAADAVGIKQVFFSPYKNQRYSTPTDTVGISEFRFNFELELKELQNKSTGFLPGNAYALSCLKTYTIRNISNITVLLTEPFAGLPIGTDISYLLELPEGKKLSELRTFDGVSVYFGTQLKIIPENYSQLKTKTFLFLRNGNQFTFDSTSPYLKTR